MARIDLQISGGGTVSPKDYLGRPLRVGDVVIYAILIGRLGGGQPLRRGVILDFEEPYAWIRMLTGAGGAATVRIHQARVLKMPAALAARQAAKLRAHTLRPRTAGERARRSGAWTSGLPAVSPTVWSTRPVSPEQTLAAVGIDDARQAEYQRKMSALLTGRP